MWKLESANAKGDACGIVYSETTQDEDGNDVVATTTVRHYRTSFPDATGKQVAQTDTQWHANIQREIAADLSDMNRVEAEEQDITAKVV